VGWSELWRFDWLRIFWHQFEVINEEAHFHIGERNAQFIRDMGLNLGEFKARFDPLCDLTFLRVIQFHGGILA
jgi:hypothetical protein